MSPLTYEEMLAQEAEAWNRAAEEQASLIPPEWEYHRRLRSNAVAQEADIGELLGMVRPGMRALDLGCNSGWLTVAMARRGARAHGIDIAQRAIEIARRYSDCIRTSLAGEATYEVADLGHVDLPPEEYDLVLARGVFHHLPGLEGIVPRIHRCLKAGGLLWVSDPRGHVAPETALLAGILMLSLPTHVLYRKKLGGLLRFGVHSPSRVRASMEAQGATPFEGVGRETDWVELVRRYFVIDRTKSHHAITGYLAAEINLPDRLAMPVLKAIASLDALLVRLRLLRSSGVTLCARKRASSPSPS